MAPPTVSGDHIAMAAKAGAIAIPARAPSQSPIFIGYKVPAEIVYGKTSYRMWLPGTPHCIAVNRYGERFATAGFYPAVETKDPRFDGTEHAQPTRPAWIVCDKNWEDQNVKMPTMPR